MTPQVRSPDARWSGALLGVAAVAAVGVVMPWVRGLGAAVPDSPDLADAELTRPGTVDAMSAQGTSGTAGAMMLALACALVVIALWRASPQYRPPVAGYLTIAVAAVAVATALWFVGDDELWYATFGQAVDVQTDSVRLTAWPWMTLGCFAAAVLVGVLLVPRRTRDPREPVQNRQG